MQIIFYFYFHLFMYVFVYVYGSRSFAHLNTAAIAILSRCSSCRNPKPLTCTTTKHAISLASYICIHEMTMHWQEERPRLHSGIIICETSVMIMPMLLFRYFGILVSTVAALFCTQPFLHVVRQSKPFVSMAYHYTIFTTFLIPKFQFWLLVKDAII